MKERGRGGRGWKEVGRKDRMKRRLERERRRECLTN